MSPEPAPEPSPGLLARPWAASADELLAALEVDRERGLSPAEARARLGRHGPNVLRSIEPRGWLMILIDQLRSVIVLLLALGAGLSFAFGRYVEGGAILVVLLVNTALGFTTELRAVRSMEGLRRLGVREVVVERGGEIVRVPAQDLVPGDLVILEGGDVIAADLRVLEGSRLQVDESPLTGESVPVAKLEEPLAAELPLAERTNMLFKGTVVTRGAGVGLVVATGHETELGRISELVAQIEDRKTPLEQALDALGRRLMWASLAFAVVIAGVGTVTGRDLVTMVETAIALAVATVPEGLPLVATLALARGMWRMARRNALIEELTAVETLGSTNVILTDKTGTLTQNQMTVARIVLEGEAIELRGAEDGPRFEREGAAVELGEAPLLRELLSVAALCTDASLGDPKARGPGEGGAIGDPMEVALLRAAVAAGLELEALRAARPELREEAFDSRVNMMATFHGLADDLADELADDEANEVLVAVKGAPESVLEIVERLVGPEGERPMDAALRQVWLDRAEALGAAGYRVLAVARKQVSAVEAEPYAELALLGLVALEDPPRRAVRPGIAALHRAGIRVVMITGDQLTTASAIARAVGLIPEENGVAEVRRADAPAEELLAASVIARSSPEQKLELLAAHQAAGDVVAMIGDGVNDAPALQQADIGVAMGRRGTEAAREAADVILQDDEFSTIVVAIEQGRIIFDNIRKFVIYLISCNLSEILIVGLAAVAGAPLPILPLQILFLNLVTDVFPALALGVSEGSEEVMDRPPRRPGEPLLTGRHWLALAGFAVLLTTAVLVGFVLALKVLELEREAAVSVSFTILAFSQVVHVFNLASPDSGPLRNEVTRNGWVWGAVVLSVGLVLAGIYTPGVSDVLGLRGLGTRGWILAVALSLVPLVLGQLGRALVGRARDQSRLRSRE